MLVELFAFSWEKPMAKIEKIRLILFWVVSTQIHQLFCFLVLKCHLCGRQLPLSLVEGVCSSADMEEWFGTIH